MRKSWLTTRILRHRPQPRYPVWISLAICLLIGSISEAADMPAG